MKQHQEQKEAAAAATAAASRRGRQVVSTSLTAAMTKKNTVVATTSDAVIVNTASPADISVSQQQTQFRHQQRRWLQQQQQQQQLPFFSGEQGSAANTAATTYGDIEISSSPAWSQSSLTAATNATSTTGNCTGEISQNFLVGSNSSIPFANQALKQERYGSCCAAAKTAAVAASSAFHADVSSGPIAPAPPSSSTEPLRKFLEPSMMGWMQSTSPSSLQRSNFTSYMSLEANKQYNKESFFDVHVTPNQPRRALPSSLSMGKVAAATAPPPSSSSRNIMLSFEKSGFKQRMIAQDNDILPTCSLNDVDVLLPLDTTIGTSYPIEQHEIQPHQKNDDLTMIDLPTGDSLNSIFEI